MNNTQPYEDLARQLADAYTSGDKETIRRINWMRGTSFVWDHDPVKMQQRLTRWFASPGRSKALAMEDARNMVARIYGFSDWTKLQSGVMEQPADPRCTKEYRSVLPPFYTIKWKENSLTVRGPQSMEHWEKIFEVINDHGLTRLDASEIPAAAMEILPQLTGLRKLACGGLTNDGLRHLARMPQIEELDMDNWRGVVSDKGLEVLRTLKNLRVFKMAWVQTITDAGISHLAGCEKLERVNLHGTKTGDGVLKALTGKPDLTHLTAGMHVTDAGLKYLHQYPVFKEWQSSTPEFNLMSYEVEPNHLMVGGTYTDAGLGSLAGLNGLFALTLLGNESQITGSGVAALGSLPHLGFFSADGEKTNDEMMEAIGRLPHLRMLLAQGAVATNGGFASLAHSQSIEYIWGRECPNLSGPGFTALAQMPALRGLAVSCKSVDDAALSALPHFPALKELMPMDVLDEGFRHIGRCEQLEALWCMYCRETTDKATEHIVGLKNLKSYYAGQTLITNRSLEILGGMDSLEELRFWNISGISSEGLQWLTRLPRLRYVMFDACINITHDATTVFPAHVQVDYSA